MIREHNKNDDWNIIQKIIHSDYEYWSPQGWDCLLLTLSSLLPPSSCFHGLSIVYCCYKAEVFVYNLALSLVLSEQVKQTHCTVMAYFYGISNENKTWKAQIFEKKVL